jgi:uncharacterized protein YbcV (DUF1398 family)
MNAEQKTCAQRCLAAAEEGTLTFPEIVDALRRAGFESYTVDFRQALTTYYLPTGESLPLPAHASPVPVAAAFDAMALQAAIREAQTLAPGYTYRGFCRKAKAAGCAGYTVSFSGRRAVYFGRTGETHVEQFPSAQ